MLELWQTEWCPASHRVRQRLTELGLDYVVHQVPVDRDDRVVLRQRTGSDTIPVLVPDSGEPVVGEEPITAYLDNVYAVTPAAAAHAAKAARARQRLLQEECKCP
jgi:glutathione S-transferase